MTEPSPNRAAPVLRAAPMVLFTIAMVLFLVGDENLDWKSLVSVALWAITVGLWSWAQYGSAAQERRT